MKSTTIKVGNIGVSNDAPMVLFGGMNVLESRDMAMQIAHQFIPSADRDLTRDSRFFKRSKAPLISH